MVWSRWLESDCKRSPSAGRCSFSLPAIANPLRSWPTTGRVFGWRRTCTLHNARLSKAAKVLYPHHPLFGKELDVWGGAGGQRDLLFVKLSNNTTRGVPAWMFDEVICSTVRDAEQPVIDCGALLRLAQLLDSVAGRSPTGNDDNSRSQTKSISVAASAATGVAIGIGGAKPTHPGEQSRQVRAVVPPTAGERCSAETCKPRRQP